MSLVARKPDMTNPFATQFVAPGAVDWIGEGQNSLEELERRFLHLGRRAQILGAHGSGKSTLLEHFVPRLGGIAYRQDPDGAETREGGGDIVWLRLRSRPMRSVRQSKEYWKPSGLLVIDGWERLGFAYQCYVAWQTHLQAMGLLVTAHRDTSSGLTGRFLRLPVLYHAEVSLPLATELVSRIAPDTVGQIDEADLRESLARHSGNFREVLMDLFDQFQETAAG